MNPKNPEVTIRKIVQRSLSCPPNAKWIRATLWCDGDRSITYYRLKRDAVAEQNQIGHTRWMRGMA